MILCLVTQGRSKVLDSELLKLHDFLLRQSLMQRLANAFDLMVLMSKWQKDVFVFVTCFVCLHSDFLDFYVSLFYLKSILLYF